MSKSQFSLSTVFSLIATVSALTACGGGGGSDAPATTGPSAEGVYGGTLTGSPSTAFNLLILDNGDYWSMYGTQGASVFGVAGFVQGTGTSSNGSFTSANGKDFGVFPAVSGSVSATYNASAKTISGTTTSTSGTSTFSGGPIAGSLYNYDAAATLSTVAGSWTTTSLTGETVIISIAAGGAFTAVSSGGCRFSGTVAPRASGKNVFNTSLTFGLAPCALPNQNATGIAVAYPLTTGRTQLIVAVTDAARTVGAAVVGTR